MNTDKFDQWCLLEIMGHQRFAGRVTEQTIGGVSFVRIDVPASEGLPAFTKLFGAGSIYCITPISEEMAALMQKSLRREAVNVYDLPDEIRKRINQPALSHAQAEDFECDELDVDDYG